MAIRGVHIETVANPIAYTYEQIEDVCAKAHAIQRGRFVYTMPPPHDHGEQLDDNGVCVFCHRLYEGDDGGTG